MNQSGQPASLFRRPRAHLSVWGTAQMHLHSPYVVAFWSAIFPGFGHMLLNKYLNGLILFLWEIGINYASRLNVAILYTFLGRFEAAKQVVDSRWLLLYVPTYLFTVWDSYRICMDLNHRYRLASREDAPVRQMRMHPLGLNYLDKTSPRTIFFWSLLAPGTGQIVLRNTLIAYFLTGWWIAIVYFSKALPAVQYTLMGEFDAARSVVNPQWLLNIPSVYLFAIYDAYVNAVENNRLFDREQSKFVKHHYQDRSFPMPFGRRGGDKMYIVSNFTHTIKLETAITAIQMKGVPKENILAVPMDKRHEGRHLFDTVDDSDSLSMLDLPMISAAVFAVFGLIYGFVLAWGPIAWALIGTVCGFGIGLLVKLITTHRRSRRRRAAEPAVVLLIACEADQMDMIQETLWANSALGVAGLSLQDDL